MSDGAGYDQRRQPGGPGVCAVGTLGEGGGGDGDDAGDRGEQPGSLVVGVAGALGQGHAVERHGDVRQDGVEGVGDGSRLPR